MQDGRDILANARCLKLTKNKRKVKNSFGFVNNASFLLAAKNQTRLTSKTCSVAKLLEIPELQIATKFYGQQKSPQSETHSVVTTSNHPLQDWGKRLSDVPSANAIPDQFLHHAETISFSGKAYRLHNRKADPKPATAKKISTRSKNRNECKTSQTVRRFGCRIKTERPN